MGMESKTVPVKRGREELSWYCVQTKPRREAFAQLHLERQGIETFGPKLRRARASRSGPWAVLGPLLPRYLFVRHRRDVRWIHIHSTRGVSSLVAFGGRPAEVVHEIRSRCDQDVLKFPPTIRKAGDPVRIVAGPFVGMEALFSRETSDRQRVVILLELIPNYAKLQLPSDYLASI